MATYDEEVIQRAAALRQRAAGASMVPTAPPAAPAAARGASPALAAATPKPAKTPLTSNPALGGGIAAAGQALAEAPRLGAVFSDKAASGMDKGSAVGESAARVGGAGAGAAYGATKGAALGSALGPWGTLAGGVIGGIGGAVLGPKIADTAIGAGRAVTNWAMSPSQDAQPAQASYSNEGRNSKQPIMDPAAPAAAAIVADAPEGVNASQTSPQAAQATPSRAAAPATPKQEGVDVGFGIRRMEGPGGTPLYTNIQPGAPMPAQPLQPMYRQPQDQPVQRMQPERQRQDVVMPRLNTRGGVFSAMADFTNQAGNALGAVAQNRANNQQDRADREDAKLGLDANRYALDAAITQNRFGMDRQRAGLDAAKAQDDMATNQVRRDASQVEIDAARQVADLQRQYLEAPDEATRADVARQLAALSGKSEKQGWKIQVTPPTRNADGSTTPGSVIRYREDTGEVQMVDGMPGMQASQEQQGELVAGQAYPRIRNGVTKNYEYLGNGQWSSTPLK